MTRRGLARVALLAPIGATLVACRTAPIQRELSADFIGRASLTERADQIRRAGASLGWNIESRRPGLMQATLNLRSHQAVVDVIYDARRLTLRYAASTNLNYDGQVIHPNYNSWVQRLQNAIISQPT